MARRAIALAASLGAASAQNYYQLDPTFPAFNAFPAGTEEVTAVAVLNGTSGRELHVAQRNGSLPFFMVFDPISGKITRTYNGSLTSPHGITVNTLQPTSGRKKRKPRRPS